MSANENNLISKEIIVGGQAVIEGVMMRTPNAYAVAVRLQDGTITHTGERLPKWSDKVPMLKLPVLRGAATLLQSMALGIKALNYAASQAFSGAESKAEANEKVDVKIAPLSPATVEGESAFAGVTGGVPGLVAVPQKKERDDAGKTSNASAALSITFALIFNALLFIAAPLLLTNAIFIGAGWATPTPQTVQTNAATPTPQTNATAQNVTTNRASETSAQTSDAKPAWYSRAFSKTRELLRPVRPSVAFNLVDGLIRMSFFLIMIFSFSLLKDIKRVFEYHGAEHKTVFAWEAGLPLTVESARIQPRQHPRCGTSFLMVVMLVSIVVFSLIKFDSLLLNMATRLLLVPAIAGLSYEIIRFSAKKESGWFFKIITKPGLWLQNITTKEPDDSQLEVAVFALKESLKLEPPQHDAALAPLS